MDENFIRLLIWHNAKEITKANGSKEDHRNVFRKMCDSLSQDYDFDDNDHNHDHLSGLVYKMIDLYCGHLDNQHEDSDYGPVNNDPFSLDDGKYEREFKEKEMLGSGAFGRVYKAVNFADNNEYAIKKVKLNGTGYEYRYMIVV